MAKGNLDRFLEGGTEIETPTPEPEVIDIQPKKRSPSPEGKKMASVFMNMRAFKQLQILKIETGLSIQELLIKALNLLFQMYGKPPIAK